MGEQWPSGTDNLKGEQCLGKGGALQGWEHFLIDIFLLSTQGRTRAFVWGAHFARVSVQKKMLCYPLATLCPPLKTHFKKILIPF